MDDYKRQALPCGADWIPPGTAVGLTQGATGNYYDNYEGILTEAKQLALRYENSELTAAKRSTVGIVQVLRKNIVPELIVLAEDIKLLSELIAFPLENRAKLRSDLNANSLKDVSNFLLDAESHLYATPSRPKECLACCRNALEELVYDVGKEIGLTATKRFANDVETLSKLKPDVLDEATLKLVRGTYDYLSLKGSHVYSAIDQKELLEADFGLNQTYNVISHLLTRYVKSSASK